MNRSLAASARRHALAAAARTGCMYGLLAATFLVDEQTKPTGSWWLVWIVAIVVSATIVVLVPLTRIADLVAQRVRHAPPTVQLHNIVSEIAVALNEPVETIVSHVSDSANVAMLPTSDGEVVVATTGALERLSRYELQALVAAQFAGMRDRWCRLATKAEILWWAMPFVAVAAVVLGLAFGRATPILWLFIGFGSLFAPPWEEHARDFCADVAAVRTTFDPQSLANAMRKLAANPDDAHNVDLGAWHLPTSPFLVVPRRMQSTTTVSSSRGTRSWTSANEVEMELTLRADRAEAMAGGANPYRLTGREFRRRWTEMGR